MRTFAQFQGSKMSSGLFQEFMDGYIKYRSPWGPEIYDPS